MDVALLIDGDQVPCADVDAAMRQAKGTLTERICVRNWRSTKDQKEWRAFAAEHSIRLIQRDPVATGKNAADIELAILAMDLHHGLGYRKFMLITGDMDFTPLVERLRRAACEVEWVMPGKGGKAARAQPKAPSKTQRAASKSPKQAKKAVKRSQAVKGEGNAKVAPDIDGFQRAVRKAITEMRKEGNHERGWVSVNRLGGKLTQQGTRKDDFGFPKRRSLREALEDAGFRVEQTETGAYRANLTS